MDRMYGNTSEEARRKKKNEQRRTRPRCDGCGCSVRNVDADGIPGASTLCRKCQEVYTGGGDDASSTS